MLFRTGCWFSCSADDEKVPDDEEGDSIGVVAAETFLRDDALALTRVLRIITRAVGRGFDRRVNDPSGHDLHAVRERPSLDVAKEPPAAAVGRICRFTCNESVIVPRPIAPFLFFFL